jgi:hypothetical protein
MQIDRKRDESPPFLSVDAFIRLVSLTLIIYNVTLRSQDCFLRSFYIKYNSQIQRSKINGAFFLFFYSRNFFT